MFALYYALGALAVFFTFAPGLAPLLRLNMMGLVGLTIFGVFGSFTFYLPELFPMRLRGTGSGFCYNIGRVVTAGFPFVIGIILRSGANPIAIIRWVAVVPAIGVLFVLGGLAQETKGNIEAEAAAAQGGARSLP
jgi:hypothetical protein